MNARFRQRVDFGPNGLERAIDALAAFLSDAGVPPRAANDVLLCVDEIGANVGAHAYSGLAEPAWLVIEAIVEQHREVRLRFEDGGYAFDPGAIMDPDTSLALDARDPGGLGIMLVRRLTDGFDYARVDGCNRLTLIKRWA